MQVSIEALSGLERKLTVSVPSEKIESEIILRLKDIARKAKVDGFRPGKVPFHVVKTRYSASAREEVARDMIQSTLYEALKEQDVIPVALPNVTPEQLEQDKDFIYSAVFEVFPTITINELDKATIETVKGSVQDSDVDAMIKKLQDQHKNWEEIARPSVHGDKVVFDFKGFLNDEPFDGGESTDFELELGSGQMIPGFEDGLIGHSAGDTFKLDIKFPDDYGHKELAGQDTSFEIKVNAVKAGVRPELDDEFASLFNIKEGGIEALRNDIQKNMSRELAKRISSINRERIFDTFIEKNQFEIPNAMVDEEIKHLKHEMYHRIYGHHHSDNEKIPDFPRELFEDNAKRRVKLGLLCSEYVKKHELNVDETRVDAMLDKLAEAYDEPNEVHDWYRADKDRIADIEALVMEELISEKMLEDAVVVEKVMDYESVMALNKSAVNSTEDME